jgi:hypothetical protein
VKVLDLESERSGGKVQPSRSGPKVAKEVARKGVPRDSVAISPETSCGGARQV